jgi:hypothetical protein
MQTLFVRLRAKSCLIVNNKWSMKLQKWDNNCISLICFQWEILQLKLIRLQHFCILYVLVQNIMESQSAGGGYTGTGQSIAHPTSYRQRYYKPTVDKQAKQNKLNGVRKFCADFAARKGIGGAHILVSYVGGLLSLPAYFPGWTASLASLALPATPLYELCEWPQPWRMTASNSKCNRRW